MRGDLLRRSGACNQGFAQFIPVTFFAYMVRHWHHGPMHLPGADPNQAKSQENFDHPEALPRAFERFTLLRRVARGGMGEVYLGSTGGIEGAERPIVVKLIRRDHETDSSFLARFLDEARIQSQLQHPGVAQILEAATDAQGKPYVVVEYVEGRNLADVRSRAGQLGVRVAWQEAVAVAITMGDALAHVHERTDAAGKPLEIVHRDLSPQNVMVGYDGDIKLIDFGTARGENRRCHTISGIVFAKPGYVAPEVANNNPGGIPADLYAYGVMLWELCAGRRFLVGDASVHLAAVGAGRRVPTPVAKSAGAPTELDQVIAKLTATNIGERYASAREVIADLVRLLQRAPSLADGDRSVRGRVAQLMRRLYPAEPARSRAEFARLVADARSRPAPEPLLPPSPEPPASREDPSLLSGTRYKKLGALGSGSSGDVYEAEHLDLGRKVALKVMHEACDPASVERFRREARAIAGLEHQNLVRLYDFGTSADGCPFYAMELVDGEALDRRLEREGALPWRAAVALVLQATSAVETAHRAGVIHRDIKPHNLLLSKDGMLKLADFGVAKTENQLECGEQGEALVIVGTPEYMAPEQASAGQADERSDLYALGAVLFELLTGALPYEAENTVALVEQKLFHAPRTLAQASGHEFSVELEEVVAHALARRPEDRYQNADELRQALLSVLAPKLEPVAKTRRIKPAAAIASTITLAVSVLVGSALASSAARAELHGAVRRAAVFAQHVSARTLGNVALARRVEVQPAAAPVSKPSAPVVTATEVAQADVDPDRMQAPAEPEQPRVEPAAALLGEDAEQAPAPVAELAAPAAQAPSEAGDDAVTKALSEAARLSESNAKIKSLHLLRRTGGDHPRDVRVLKAWVDAAEQLKAWGEARKIARKWVEVESSTEAQLTLARLERATGNRDRALAILGNLATESPQSNEIRELIELYAGQKRVALNR